jgi:hypothetical protein
MPVGSSGIRGMQPLADRAFERTAGAQLVPGNRVRILKTPPRTTRVAGGDPRAERTVYFESYIIGDDRSGASSCRRLPNVRERAFGYAPVRLARHARLALALAPLMAAGGAVRVSTCRASTARSAG